MSTTIDSLNIQIISNAGVAATKIDALAKSLDGLKASSKLTTVTNNLKKLATALDTLNGKQFNFTGFKDLMASMTSIQKLSGLNSALNTLNKIPNITKNLDVATLDRFARAMEKISVALGPVASKIDTISNGFAKLPGYIRSSVSATKGLSNSNVDLADSFDASSVSLMANISNLESLMTVVNSVVDVMAKAIGQAIEWDGIQYRFGRAFGEDAEEVYQHVLKINDVLGINTQEFMQYSSMYGSLLSGFGLAQEKVTTISVGLSELTYDLWAANNDVVKRYEDVAVAVKSAITGEIEPIRNLGIAMTEASLQEFIDTTNLAGMSIEKMTEAQKSEVRYAAMVNAAMNQGIVGTYAREMHTAEGAIRSLSQSTKGLVQAFGSLFIPILQAVIPYITAFVEVLTDAVHWVAALFGIQIQKIDWSSSTKGIGDMATGAKEAGTGLDKASKAAKKLKDYTMGFDELNVISPDTGSAGGGAGGAGGAAGWGEGLDLDTLWDDSVFDSASKKVDEIKQKILDFFDTWKWGIALVGTLMAGLFAKKMIPKILDSALYKALSGAIFKVIDTVNALWGIFKGSEAAKSAFTMMHPVITKIATALSGAISAVGSFLAGLSAPAWAVIVAVIAAIGSVIYFMYENWDKVVTVVKNFFELNIAPKLEDIKGHFGTMKDAVGHLLDTFGDAGKRIKDFFEGIDWSKLDWIAKLFEGLGGIIFSVVGGVIATAFNMFMGVVENFVQFFSGVVQMISGFISAIVALFTGDLSQAWESAKLIGEGIKTAFMAMVEAVAGLVSDFVIGIITWFTDLWDELVGHSIVPDMCDAIVDTFDDMITNVVDAVKTFVADIIARFKEMWKNIKSWWSESVAPKFTLAYWISVFSPLVKAIKDKLTEFKKTITDKWTEIKSWWSSNVAPKLTLTFWLDKFKNLKDGFVQTVKNMINSGIEMLNKFIDWLNDRMEFSWDGIEIAGEEIVPSGSIQLFTIPKIPKFENGGFLEDGLFTMNHGEIAGKFSNGQSVVANNEQIVAGISEGVYQAVVAAMSQNQSGGQAVNVYLDGKQIYSSVKKTESRRGMSLMGNQLGYSY